MTIGNRIKNKRSELGMSQVELAEKTHSSKQTIYKYENEIITNIPLNKIEQIADVLGTTPAYLMGWEDNLTKSNANLIADILMDTELLSYIEKISRLSPDKKYKVYGYIDSLEKQG